MTNELSVEDLVRPCYQVKAGQKALSGQSCIRASLPLANQADKTCLVWQDKTRFVWQDKTCLVLQDKTCLVLQDKTCPVRQDKTCLVWHTFMPTVRHGPVGIFGGYQKLLLAWHILCCIPRVLALTVRKPFGI